MFVVLGYHTCFNFIQDVNYSFVLVVSCESFCRVVLPYISSFVHIFHAVIANLSIFCVFFIACVSFKLSHIASLNLFTFRTLQESVLNFCKQRTYISDFRVLPSCIYFFRELHVYIRNFHTLTRIPLTFIPRC